MAIPRRHLAIAAFAILLLPLADAAALHQHHRNLLGHHRANKTSDPTPQSPSTARTRPKPKPMCAHYDRDTENVTHLIPPFALADSDSDIDYGLRNSQEKLRRDIDTLLERIEDSTEIVRVCFHNDKYFKAKAAMSAWSTFFEKTLNVEVVVESDYLFRTLPDIDLMETCDISIVWAVKGPHFFKARRNHQRFPHTLVIEEPLIWRTDPRDGKILWTSAFWDYLNGYSVKWNPSPSARWQSVFERKMARKPWSDPKPNGTILIIGQVPTDTAVIRTRLKYGTIDNAYRHIIDSVRSVYPDKEIIYRPHPYLNDHKVKCRLVTPRGVIVRTYEQKTLHKELDEAAVVITLSSTASIEAILLGVPVITLDPASPIWSVACHDFSNLQEAVEGHGCRPDRDQWLYDLSYSMWTINEVEDGQAFDYLFGYSEWKNRTGPHDPSSPMAQSPPPAAEPHRQ